MTPTGEVLRQALKHPVVRVAAVALLQAAVDQLSRPGGAAAAGCACPAPPASVR